jgi:hypothetical protein
MATIIISAFFYQLYDYDSFKASIPDIHTDTWSFRHFLLKQLNYRWASPPFIP